MLNEVEINKVTDPKDCISEDDLFNQVMKHQDDMNDVMLMLSEHLRDMGSVHDWTKTDFFTDFYEDSLERQKETPTPFHDRDWFNIHCTYERHHLNSRIPSDVDLFDLLEFICDCMVTSMEHEEDLNKYFLLLNNQILYDAYWNTVEKIRSCLKYKE